MLAVNPGENAVLGKRLIWLGGVLPLAASTTSVSDDSKVCRRPNGSEVTSVRGTRCAFCSEGIRSLAGLTVFTLAFVALGFSQNALPASRPVDFASDIRPIFEERCYTCHSDEAHQGDFRLNSRESVLRGGGSGIAAIVPGDSATSLLYRYVARLDKKIFMPPVGPPLTGDQVELIREWIDQGAKWPESEREAKADTADSLILERGRSHWAFQPRTRPSVPALKDSALARRVRNPIDAFVFAKLEERGWRPSPQAEPYQLLRRVYLDLTGLPPNIQEQDAFLQSPTAESLDGLVDDLLERPAYGERWGRHWLDLVRYAETNGYERDAIKPMVWRYRDYVIRSFNEDKPFDRFAMEQLAGDELPDVSPETLIASGFHRLGPWDDEPANPLTDRYDQLDDMVRTTSEVFLGVTLGCARCHNHKFEPFTARDYYSFLAVFSPLTRPQEGRKELLRPIGTGPELDAYAARDRQIEALERGIASIRLAVQTDLLDAGRINLPPDAVRAFQTPETERDQVQQALVKEFTKQLDTEVSAALPDSARDAIEDLKMRVCTLREQTPTADSAYLFFEPRRKPAPSHVLIRGQATNPGPEVPPAAPAILAKESLEFPAWDESARTSRRRLTVAQWIASPDNPLTARVIVNRVWQFHFGEGIVRTPSDFGLMGEAPTHPELLDWLANWFVENGWSIKKLHRLIMRSSAYRMSKAWNPEYGAEDPDSRLLWRVPYRRLEVEAIRDSMLAISGHLNRRMYGPSMYPYVPPAALEGSSDPDKIWKPFDEPDASRRTIYAIVKRSLIVPMLEVLDFCDTTRSSAKRINTAVAPQALTLFNGEFVNGQARHLATRLRKEAGPKPVDQIELAYRLALGRSPTKSERQDLLKFLRVEAEKSMRKPDGDRDAESARERALLQMCRVIFNMNEFVYPD